jgi:hypothetical protein
MLMPPPYEGCMANASMGEWGSHAPTSSTIHVPQSFHGAPSNKCKKKEPQTLPIKLGTFTIGAIWRRAGTINTRKDTTRRTISINHRKIK